MYLGLYIGRDSSQDMRKVRILKTYSRPLLNVKVLIILITYFVDFSRPLPTLVFVMFFFHTGPYFP
jgi:ABC-type amino acid transport system permease subunit